MESWSTAEETSVEASQPEQRRHDIEQGCWVKALLQRCHSGGLRDRECLRTSVGRENSTFEEVSITDMDG